MGHCKLIPKIKLLMNKEDEDALRKVSLGRQENWSTDPEKPYQWFKMIYIPCHVVAFILMLRCFAVKEFYQIEFGGMAYNNQVYHCMIGYYGFQSAIIAFSGAL